MKWAIEYALVQHLGLLKFHVGFRTRVINFLVDKKIKNY